MNTDYQNNERHRWAREGRRHQGSRWEGRISFWKDNKYNFLLSSFLSRTLSNRHKDGAVVGSGIRYIYEDSVIWGSVQNVATAKLRREKGRRRGGVGGCGCPASWGAFAQSRESIRAREKTLAVGMYIGFCGFKAQRRATTTFVPIQFFFLSQMRGSTCRDKKLGSTAFAYSMSI